MRYSIVEIYGCTMASTMIQLHLLKYSEKGAAAVMQEGLTSRRAAVDKALEGVGGRLVGFWGTDDGQWDAVFVTETPADVDLSSGVALNLRGQASGTWERIRSIYLYPPEDVDRNLQASDTFRYAGQQ
jgi:uncharacterized protein with GYD domain